MWKTSIRPSSDSRDNDDGDLEVVSLFSLLVLRVIFIQAKVYYEGYNEK
jgi:hypothetical protein